MKLKSVLLILLFILSNLSILLLVPTSTIAAPRYPINSFNSGVSTGLPTTGYYDCIAVGNIDGGTYMDFVCGGDDFDAGSSTQGLYYFSSNGDGSWSQTNITTSNSWAGVEIADTDGDGNDEVFGAHTESSSSIGVGVWEWSGSGFSQSGITSPYTSDGVNYVNILNITGDSNLDILVACYDRGVKYFEGDGSWGWTEYSSGLPSWGQMTQSAVTDYNKDGRPDIMVGHYGNGLKFYTQDSGGTSWTDRTSTLPATEQSGRILGVATGDVNKDGNMDVVYARRTSPTGLFLLLGNGGGSNGTDFQWTYLNGSWSTRPTGTFYQMHLDDVDMDGDLDLLAPKESTGLHLYLGNGSDTPGLNFSWSEVTGKGLPTTMKFYGSGYIDFDNDKDLDVVGCTWGNGIHVYENNMTLPDVPVPRAGADQIAILGNPVTLDGTNSTDPQDCPNGDTAGTLLTYDWNFTGQPTGSSLDDTNLTPSDSDAKPSFIPTHEGEYTLTLRVQDTENHWSMGEDIIRINVISMNTRPIANAGQDQEVLVGSLVTLNGSGSYDNEDLFGQLTFDWNISLGNPDTVTLSDESDIFPTFTAPSTTGNYQFTLRIQDTLGLWSAEDLVNINVTIQPNIIPQADAGSDFTAYSNTTVSLNGSLSFDSDGMIVSWDWECLSFPTVEFTLENSSTPTFKPVQTGIYNISLVVKDNRGAWSVADHVEVTVIEEPKIVPVAHAGSDFTTYKDEIAYLNGSLSYDLDGSIFYWDWNCISHPSLLIFNQNSSSPYFIPQVVTTYTFSLRVQDDHGLWSSLDEVNVSVIDLEIAKNKKPISDAGTNQTDYVNTTIVLDGSSSFDPDGEIITWDWNCTSHSVTIDSENSSTPSFYATEPGTYVFTLRIMDNNYTWSDEVTIYLTILKKIEDNNNTNGNNTTFNHLPTITITAPLDGAVLSNTTSITWTAHDEDSDALTFDIDLLNANGDFIKSLYAGLSTNYRSVDWDTRSQVDGSYRIRISTSDGKSSVFEMSGIFQINNPLIKKEETIDEEPVDNSAFNIFSLLILILIIIVIVVVVLVLLIKRKRPEEEDQFYPEYPVGDYEGSADYQAEHVGYVGSDMEPGHDSAFPEQSQPDQSAEFAPTEPSESFKVDQEFIGEVQEPSSSELAGAPIAQMAPLATPVHVVKPKIDSTEEDDEELEEDSTTEFESVRDEE